jgi:large subunit ribosomal protein L24
VSTHRIRKNDTVVVRAGADAGSSGKVLQVMAREGRALVEGVNIVKKCLRKSQENPQGGIVDKEGPIALSKLMPFCPECKKGVRVAKVKDGDRVVRKCKPCGYVFD